METEVLLEALSMIGVNVIEKDGHTSARINRLVVVSDDADSCPEVVEAPHDCFLNRIYILILVHDDVPDALCKPVTDEIVGCKLTAASMMDE
jgi:hypothetical protein